MYHEPKPQRIASPPSPAETKTLINQVPSALRRARAGDHAALDDLAEFLLSTRPPAADRAEAARILAKAKHVTARGALRRLVADQSLDDTARAELARRLHDLGDRSAAAAALLAAEPAEGLRVARALVEDTGAGPTPTASR